MYSVVPSSAHALSAQSPLGRRAMRTRSPVGDSTAPKPKISSSSVNSRGNRPLIEKVYATNRGLACGIAPRGSKLVRVRQGHGARAKVRAHDVHDGCAHVVDLERLREDDIGARAP